MTRGRVFVPRGLPPALVEPADWPRITPADNHLDVPAVGIVHRLQADVLGYRWIAGCGPNCFATWFPAAPCIRSGAPWETPNVALPGCIDAVDLALVVHELPVATTPLLYVVTGGPSSVAELLRLIGNDHNDTDPCDMRFGFGAHNGELVLNSFAAPSSAVTRLRRHLVLPDDWERIDNVRS